MFDVRWHKCLVPYKSVEATRRSDYDVRAFAFVFQNSARSAQQNPRTGYLFIWPIDTLLKQSNLGKPIMGRSRKSSHLGDIPGDTTAPAMSTMNEVSPVEEDAPKWDKVYPYR